MATKKQKTISPSKAIRKKYAKYQPDIKVHCSECEEWYSEELVEFVNIEEDFEGKDVLTFKCPYCETIQKSHRVR